MLPLFAASGHTLFAKFAHVYLLSILKLQKTHPDLYQKFEAESHVVRHSDRYKAGLIIVQVLMRSVKTHGGLTRGRERQRSLGMGTFYASMKEC